MKEIINKIKEYDEIIILRHQLADPDALGSQFGLASLIKDNFPNKTIHCLGENTIGLNNKLYPEMDVLSNEISKPFLVIVLDTANKERIDNDIYLKADYLIKIDHHLIVDSYGNYNYEDEQAASTSSIITSLAIEYQLKVSDVCATYLYAGIIADSGRFLYNSTNSKTLNLASFLLENNANMKKVYDTLYTRTIEEVRLNAHILSNFIYDEGLAYFILDESDYHKFNVTFESAKNLVNTLAGIEGINIWMSVTLNPVTKIYHVSLRSKDYNVNQVAVKHNGGGHLLASGLKIKTLKELDEIIIELKEILK